jgi:hypothetical protein
MIVPDRSLAMQVLIGNASVTIYWPWPGALIVLLESW